MKHSSWAAGTEAHAAHAHTTHASHATSAPCIQGGQGSQAAHPPPARPRAPGWGSAGGHTPAQWLPWPAAAALPAAPMALPTAPASPLPPGWRPAADPAGSWSAPGGGAPQGLSAAYRLGRGSAAPPAAAAQELPAGALHAAASARPAAAAAAQSPRQCCCRCCCQCCFLGAPPVECCTRVQGCRRSQPVWPAGGVPAAGRAGGGKLRTCRPDTAASLYRASNATSPAHAAGSCQARQQNAQRVQVLLLASSNLPGRAGARHASPWPPTCRAAARVPAGRC